MSQLSLIYTKKKTDTIDLVVVAKEFISVNEEDSTFLEALMNSFHC